MSLPDKALFGKICNLRIGNALFKYPPFSIEFEQTQDLNKPSVTKVKLYNPNNDTVKAVEPKPKGKTFEYVEIQIDAGFESDYGTVCVGEISDYHIYKQGVDRILELTVGDIAGKWANLIIGKSFNNMTNQDILDNVLDIAQAKGKVLLGEIKKMKSFSAGSFKDVIKNLTKSSSSNYYFRNGKVYIEPKDPAKINSIAYISPTTGLIKDIEKETKGYKFNTVFFYNVQVGDMVQIQDNKYDKTNVKIVGVKKLFSTFGTSECQYRAVEI